MRKAWLAGMFVLLMVGVQAPPAAADDGPNGPPCPLPDDGGIPMREEACIQYEEVWKLLCVNGCLVCYSFQYESGMWVPPHTLPLLIAFALAHVPEPSVVGVSQNVFGFGQDTQTGQTGFGWHNVVVGPSVEC